MPAAPQDLAGADLARGPVDLGTAADLSGSHCNNVISPSGYSCDPWSTHLYLASTVVRQGGNLRLLLVHNPDNEGSITDQMIPPEHDFSQQLTVDIALTAEARRFLCVVFTPDGAAASFDARGASFLTDVGYSDHTLLMDDNTATPHVANLSDICSGSQLPALHAPQVAQGRPVLPDVALAIPLSPKPTGFTVGTQVHAWLARGVLYVDEESELSPQLTATVVGVQ